MPCVHRRNRDRRHVLVSYSCVRRHITNAQALRVSVRPRALLPHRPALSPAFIPGSCFAWCFRRRMILQTCGPFFKIIAVGRRV